MSSRIIKEIVVLDVDKYVGEFPPENLTEFIQWFTKILHSIPVEHRETAEVGIDSITSHEETHFATIKVSYSRPETDGELSCRLNLGKHRSFENENKEREILSILKQKYETSDVRKD